jgi:hypothetical protein
MIYGQLLANPTHILFLIKIAVLGIAIITPYFFASWKISCNCITSGTTSIGDGGKSVRHRQPLMCGSRGAGKYYR